MSIFFLFLQMKNSIYINKRYRLLFFISLFFFLFPFSASSQEVIGVSIYSGKSLHVYPRYAVSICSDLTNSGSFGSDKNATIIFLGQRWSNKAGSSMPDESFGGTDGIGGNFKFAGKGSAPQYIDNQNNLPPGSEFPNMSIANSEGVILEGSDLAIRNNLNFETGHLILNNRNTIIGIKGSITGYNENRYVVTSTGISGGGLTRSTSGQQQGDIVFPVGTTVGSYTPASLAYIGIAQNLKVRVFETVYDKAIFGATDHVNAVNKTWNLSMNNTDPNAKLTINMQHNSNEESSQFTSSQSESFVSRFLSTTDQWDIMSATGVTPGVITSANPIPNSFVSSRTNIGNMALNEYFSKWIRKSNGLTEVRIPGGISPNNDGLNDRFTIQNLNPTDKVRLEIYNKWQMAVFKDPNYKNTFEGTGNQGDFMNIILPDATYFYIININDGKPLKGYLIINR
jgi:gliding motility-associated-like protein